MKTLDELRDKIRLLPEQPGIYIFKNSKNKIIYVGKATSLRKRVGFYFTGRKKATGLTDFLVNDIKDIEFVVADSPLEALILENQWIKQNQPQYNILLKDDKTYPYIKFTVNEQYPRIYITRKVHKDGASYYGPFIPASGARKLLSLIYKFFKIRQCSITIDESTKNVCMLFHIQRCSGPCAHLVNENEYREKVRCARMFLEGRINEVLQNLRQQMQVYANNLQFETAAIYRDAISMIENLDAHPKIFSHNLEDSDIIGYFTDAHTVSINIFQMRRGNIISRKEYILRHIVWENEESLLAHIIMQYYSDSVDVPSRIYVTKYCAESAMIEKWFAENKNTALKINAPRTGKRKSLVDFAMKNARNTYMLQNEINEEEELSLREELQRAFHLPQIPYRIEAFDIAHVFGRFTVASMIVYDNNKFNRKEYRRYKIRSSRKADDYAAMGEVVERRILRLLKEQKLMPDLVIIDGGKGQLNAAKRAAMLHNVKIPMISIAKEYEEIYLLERDEPLLLPRNSRILKTIQKIRDEAHRFANTYHRIARSKYQKASLLDSIKGIGPQKKKVLFGRFKDLDGLRRASVDQLSSLIGKKLACRLHELLEKQE